MKRARLTQSLAGLAVVIGIVWTLPPAYARAIRPSLEGIRDGMTRAEFDTLRLPYRSMIGSGPTARHSEVFYYESGHRLLTTWDTEQTPARLLSFKPLP